LRHSPDRPAVPALERNRLVATAVGLVLAGSLTLGGAGFVLAQDDGTGGSPLPGPTECVLVPARAAVVLSVPATPVEEPATPAASTAALPIIEPVGSPQASPVIEPPASPVASPQATPVTSPEVAADLNAGLLAELEATANSIFGCLNERNFEMYARMTSDTLRGQQFGSSQPMPASQFVPLAATLPDVDYRIVEFGNIEAIDETTVAVDVSYVSAHQLKASTWTFVQAEVDGHQAWVLDRETPLPAPAPEGASVIDVTFQDTAYTLSPESASGPDLVLELDNPTDEDHEALVVRLDEGVTTASLLQGGPFPEGVTFIGQATVLAGGSGTLVLTGLEPGAYTIVDLLPDANGLPHLSSGMEATFTID
jgi:hypothetical protein